MNIAEHRLTIIHQIEALSEESLIELEKIIAKLTVNQKINSIAKKRRQPPASIAGKAKIIHDLIAPCVDIEDIECLK